jgi:transketolase
MRQPVTYVFTHDSIFVGEDGPTHQPVEQVAALRAIPRLEVWRPADAREVACAWRRALERDDGPLALVLTRQGVPVLEADGIEQAAIRGGYVLEAESDPNALELVIVGTGSEVHPALAAARALASGGRSVRTVSIPCLEVYLEQDDAYRASVLPQGAPRVVVEAGVEFGLSAILRPGDVFHGMTGFGESAPYKVLGEHFGFTEQAVKARALELLS